MNLANSNLNKTDMWDTWVPEAYRLTRVKIQEEETGSVGTLS